MWLMPILLSAIAAGCGGGEGKDPILGTDDVIVVRPTVTAETPVDGAAAVSVNTNTFTVTFSEAVAPIGGSSSFTVTCATPCISPTGTVALDATNRIATFTQTPGLILLPSTQYTGTVTGAESLATGLTIANPHVWTFTTGTADSVRPRVTVTQPVTTVPGPTPAVPVTTAITATFTEDMAAATIDETSFTVTCVTPCVSPAGDVSYVVATRTATFDPSATSLDAATTYTVTITTATTDLAGNALAGNQALLPAASDYVWTFTTQSPPTVSAIAPLDDAVGVPINIATVLAEFSEAMTPLTGAASFTVTCGGSCTSPTGTVALDATNRLVAFEFTTGTTLEPLTLYTATITAAESLATGLALQSPYVWSFTTGLTADTTRPRVLLTDPVTTSPGPTPGVPANTAVTALFTEDMDVVTIDDTSFTLTCAGPCVSPAGTVTYSVGSRSVVFEPDVDLTPATTYTATITTAATDLARNALAGNQAPLPAASNYVWTFTTAAAILPANISVLSTQPDQGDVGICPDATINATFTVPSGLRLNPVTVNASTFTVTGPAPGLTPVIAASVMLDPATGQIATFTPQSDLTVGATYTAVLVGDALGVTDLAIPGNTMIGNASWTFTVGPATGLCLQPVALGTVGPYGTFGGSAGMTNTGIQTEINGDIGTIATTTSSVTGFHDTAGDIYTETPANIGTVNGAIYTCTNSTTGPTSASPNAASCAVATQARLDAEAAYLALAAMPSSATPAANLALLTLGPGVYTAPAGSFLIEGGDLTLDALGNVNAVWVFQMASTLTVGGPGAAAPQSIILAGGAQAKNVFWQVGTFATINAGGGGTMVGTIISQAGASFSTFGNTTIVTLEGRALSLGASVTLVDTIVNVPAP